MSGPEKLVEWVLSILFCVCMIGLVCFFGYALYSIIMIGEQL